MCGKCEYRIQVYVDTKYYPMYNGYDTYNN